MTTEEEQILFHTLGYEYNPCWRTSRREIRNDYYGAKDDPQIQKLVADGYMEYMSDGWVADHAYYRLTDKGISFVEEEYNKKKALAKKPTRSQRRYLAYLDISDAGYFDNDFPGFLKWISGKATGEETDYEIWKELKDRWRI